MIDKIILTESNLQSNIQESLDSTQRKLIYQVPFTETGKLVEILK